MKNIIRVEPHPLGVIVDDNLGGRELLIEGETCCGLSFEQLSLIASTTRNFEVDDKTASIFRLKNP